MPIRGSMADPEARTGGASAVAVGVAGSEERDDNFKDKRLQTGYWVRMSEGAQLGFSVPGQGRGYAHYRKRLNAVGSLS